MATVMKFNQNQIKFSIMANVPAFWRKARFDIRADQINTSSHRLATKRTLHRAPWRKSGRWAPPTRSNVIRLCFAVDRWLQHEEHQCWISAQQNWYRVAGTGAVWRHCFWQHHLRRQQSRSATWRCRESCKTSQYARVHSCFERRKSVFRQLFAFVNATCNRIVFHCLCFYSMWSI